MNDGQKMEAFPSDISNRNGTRLSPRKNVRSINIMREYKLLSFPSKFDIQLFLRALQGELNRFYRKKEKKAALPVY